MAIINGGDIKVYNGATLIANGTSHSLTINMATRETSSKDSGIYTARESGRLDVSVSADGLVATSTFGTLLSLIVARTALTLNLKQDTTTLVSGSFYLTSVEQSAPDQDNVTYSCSFEYAGGTLTIN